MDNHSRFRRFALVPLIIGPAFLACPLSAAAAGEEAMVLAQEPARPTQAAPAAALTLADCVQIALGRQPALAAQRASVAAAETGRQAADNLRLAGLVSKELPIRRRQAALGVVIAAAGASQAEWETIYAVTRNYFTVLYARQQQMVVKDVADDLRATLVAARGLVESGARRDVTQSNLDQISSYLLLAEARQVEAERGAERALAALREAIGVDLCFNLQIAAESLPNPRPVLTREQVVEWALGRRGELAQAVSAAEVTALEVQAQDASCRISVRTFATGGDIHARPVPQGYHNADYRPSAVGLEMPAMLFGHRADRVHQAQELSARAQAVVEKTRNLITLEAENTFLLWQQAAEQIDKTSQAADKATRLGKNTQRDFAGNQNVRVRDVLDALVLSAEARRANNEALYRQLLALADLQRVTAGGFILGLDGRPQGQP